MRVLFSLLLAQLATTALAGQGLPAPGEIQWASAPALFPKGASMALLSGDPIGQGRFRALIAMPDGYRMPPHHHTEDEHVEVLEGSFLVGVGDRFDPKKTRALAPGDTVTAPAGVHHFAMARGRTVIAVTAEGPYVMTYVRPDEEPWRPFPYGY